MTQTKPTKTKERLTRTVKEYTNNKARFDPSFYRVFCRVTSSGVSLNISREKGGYLENYPFE